MERGRIMVTSLESEAFHFKSRMGALQICGTTAEFRGAFIVEASAQSAPPRPQEAA
jgi:hypothetical protein